LDIGTAREGSLMSGAWLEEAWYGPETTTDAEEVEPEPEPRRITASDLRAGASGVVRTADRGTGGELMAELMR
jgi:hypothetical protein